MGRQIGNLTLHEALIMALLWRKLSTGLAEMTNHELRDVIRTQQSFRQDNGDFPDEAQVFLRARECPAWFDRTGDARDGIIRLRRLLCSGPEAR